MLGASTAFFTWKMETELRKRKETVMIRFAARLMNADVARAWFTWKERTEELKIMEQVMFNYANQLMFKCFKGWQRYHIRQRGGGLRRFVRWFWEVEERMASAIWEAEMAVERALLPRRHEPHASARDSDSGDDDDDEDYHGRRHRGVDRRGAARSKRDPSEPLLPAMDGPFASRPHRLHSSLAAREAVREYRLQEASRTAQGKAHQASLRRLAGEGARGGRAGAQSEAFSSHVSSAVDAHLDGYMRVTPHRPAAHPSAARPSRAAGAEVQVDPSAAAGIRSIRTSFDYFDRNGSGYLDYRELRNALGHYGIDLSSEEARRLVLRYDDRPDGKLDIGEFAQLISDLEAGMIRAGVRLQAEALRNGAPPPPTMPPLGGDDGAGVGFGSSRRPALPPRADERRWGGPQF